MRKIMLMLLLTVVSNAAMAEWVRLGSTNSLTFYADPSTIRKRGNLVKMWFMDDFKDYHDSPTKPYRSTRGQDEYDCEGEQIRGVHLTSFSESMGRGDTVNQYNDIGKWYPIAPSSSGETMWKFACGVQ